MGATTAIQWCDHTFNPWWGCTKVSEACRFCYAESWSERFPRVVGSTNPGGGLWGPDAPRSIASDKTWNDPIRWNRAAERDGVRRRVFCASMSDVFEDRRDLDDARTRLWGLIRQTPALDWLLLTKRPDRVRTMIPPSWGLHGWPANVWMGTTVEDQVRALERVPALLSLPARVRFLSLEPLLEAVDLTYLAWHCSSCRQPIGAVANAKNECGRCEGEGEWRGVDWLIIGGESGHGSRPFNFAWARSLVALARAAGAAPFVKQLGAKPVGEWGPNPPMLDVMDLTNGGERRLELARRKNGVWRLSDKKGGSPAEWPEDLRVREFPEARS
jgi:protein gp37